MLRATTACTFSTSQRPKVARSCGVLSLFTSTCASRRNGVHFFHISTSKSRPNVAPSTFGSQNVQNTPRSDHFWTIRCRKSAHRCGAKHILTKRLKLPHVRATFGSCDVEKVHAVVARSTFRSKKWQNTWCSDHFLTIRWRFDVEKVHAVVARSTFQS